MGGGLGHMGGGLGHMGGVGGMHHGGIPMGGAHLGGWGGAYHHVGPGIPYRHHSYGGIGLGGLGFGYGLGGLGYGLGGFGFGLGNYGLGYGLGGYGLGYGGYNNYAYAPYTYSGDPYSSYYGGAPTTYSRGYSSVTSTNTGGQPYPTTQSYEPGDGYRYQLWYNPATGTYFYYPQK